MKLKVTQSCLTLCDPMDCISSVQFSPVAQSCPTLCNPMNHSTLRILQVEILESFTSPGDLPNPGSNPGLPHCRRILYQVSHKGSPRILKWVAYPFSNRSSQNLGIELGSPALQVDSLSTGLSGKPLTNRRLSKNINKQQQQKICNELIYNIEAYNLTSSNQGVLGNGRKQGVTECGDQSHYLGDSRAQWKPLIVHN